jgi:hypothetical protein
MIFSSHGLHEINHSFNISSCVNHSFLLLLICVEFLISFRRFSNSLAVQMDRKEITKGIHKKSFSKTNECKKKEPTLVPCKNMTH